MTSAIPAATDALVVLATQTVAGVGGAVVADGWSDAVATTMFGVGSDEPPFFLDQSAANVEGTPTWAGLGAKHIQEEFTVPCYIYVGAGGATNQPVRAAAFALWDVFSPLFVADLTLAGALHGGRYAEIERFVSRGPRNAEEAQGGRYCLIQFYVRCTNLI